MNTKKLGLLAIAGVSLLTLAGCASTTPQTQELSEQDMSAQAVEIIQPAIEVEGMEQEEVQIQEQNLQAGMYSDYSQAAVDQALADGKKVALFFHATRCPPCRALDKEISRNINQLPENTVTFKLNYDSELELKKKYNITMQHTVVTIDQNKEEIEKSVGSADLAKVISMLQ